MRCKAGDLAVVVGGRCPKNFGRLVRVIRPAKVGDTAVSKWRPWDGRSKFGGAWWVESVDGRPMEVISTKGQRVVTDGCGRVYADCCLRPIRDEDGEDEILRIAGKPKEIQHG